MIKFFLNFSICSVFNAIFKFVERKLMIRIVSSTRKLYSFVVVYVIVISTRILTSTYCTRY